MQTILRVFALALSLVLSVATTCLPLPHGKTTCDIISNRSDMTNGASDNWVSLCAGQYLYAFGEKLMVYGVSEDYSRTELEAYDKDTETGLWVLRGEPEQHLDCDNGFWQSSPKVNACGGIISPLTKKTRPRAQSSGDMGLWCEIRVFSDAACTSNIEEGRTSSCTDVGGPFAEGTCVALELDASGDMPHLVAVECAVL